MTLSGRTAALTGASRGIGLAIAHGLLAEGADVVCLQRSPLDPDLVARASALERRLTLVSAELDDENSIAAAIEQTLAIAPVDILINNAGVQARYDAIDFPLDEFDRVMRVNTRCVMQLSQGFGRGMLQRKWGRIVSVASLLSFQGGWRVPAYAASKGAVAQLTKALSNEWAGRGVTVNAVAPGYISTDMNEALLADEVRRAQIDVRIPAGRWGRPDDLVGPVLFLCSDAAAYVTGIVLPVDGGWLGR